MFLPASFNPTSFSRVSFNGASQPVVQDSRSGYWRLFFTQLQENSDKATQTKEPVVATKKPTKKLAVVKKQPQPVDDDEPEEIPYAPIAAPKPLQYDAQCYLADTWRITTEIRGWLIQHRINVVKYHLTLDAANDEDDIEILLLVA